MKNAFLKIGLQSSLFAMGLFGIGLILGKSLSYSSQQVVDFIITVTVLIIVTYFGIKKIRDQFHSGELKFGRAFMYGLLLTFFVGLGIALIDYFYTKFINPDFYTDYINYHLDYLKETVSAEEFEERKTQIEAAPAYQKSSWFIALGRYFVSVFWGFFVSLAMAMILKSNK